VVGGETATHTDRVEGERQRHTLTGWRVERQEGRQRHARKEQAR